MVHWMLCLKTKCCVDPHQARGYYLCFGGKALKAYLLEITWKPKKIKLDG
jgi:hypothetical protein